MVWDCIGEGMDRHQIVEQILNEYDVGEEQCTADVAAIIASFLEAGLIVSED